MERSDAGTTMYCFPRTNREQVKENSVNVCVYMCVFWIDVKRTMCYLTTPSSHAHIRETSNLIESETNKLPYNAIANVWHRS